MYIRAICTSLNYELCASGGIGRREGLKIPWMDNPCGFDSRLAHHFRVKIQIVVLVDGFLVYKLM